MKKILLLPALILVLGSCKNTWNEEAKDSWLKSCKSDSQRWFGKEASADVYCKCVLDKLEKKYPNLNDALNHVDEIAKDTAIQSCKFLIE